MNELMIDSGAYSALTRGAKIAVEDYGQFLVEQAYWAAHKINLDAIPSIHASSAQEFEGCAEQSWTNYEYLKNQGITGLIPVYHYGERPYWYERMLDEGVVVALAATSTPNKMLRQSWYLKMYEIALARVSEPRLHLLGDLATSVGIMPWYSADATTPSMAGAYGHVAIFGSEHTLSQVHLSFFNRRGMARPRDKDGSKLPAGLSFSSLEELPEGLRLGFEEAYAKAVPIFSKLFPHVEPNIRTKGRLRTIVGLCSLAKVAQTCPVKLFVGIGTMAWDRVGMGVLAGLPYLLISYATYGPQESVQRGMRKLQRWCQGAK